MRIRQSLTSLAFMLLVAVPPASAQVVANTRPLGFGKFVAQGGGSVTILPSGARSAAGSVLLIASGPGSSATFHISDAAPENADKAFIITLPANGSVTVDGPSGSMPLDDFTSDPADTGNLTAGSQTINVGATLTVAPNQAAGSYSGSFPIIINYQ